MFPQPPFPLKREPTASAPRGDTLSTRINRYRPLVISLRFVRQLRNNTAQSLVLFRQARRSLSRRRCGSCSVFEVAHFVYKYAWFLKKCRKNIKNSAKTALKCLQNNFIYNIIHSEPASQRSVFCSKGG